jgi:hypothetical protein
VDALYAEALLDLEAQPLLVEYHQLRAARSGDAGSAEHERRRLALKQELAAHYPRQWKKYIMRTRAHPRTPRASRRSNAS